MPPKVIGPKRAISIELLLFLAYSFFSASWMVGSIITPDMAQEFGVYTVPSSVNNAISAAKILGNFIAAWILLKLGPKRTVSLSCLLICAVVVGAFSTTFPLFIITRFLLGFGGAILMICMTPYVVYCFEEKQHSLFIGINNAGPNTGNLIALLSVTPVRVWLGSWRSVILFYAAFSVVFLVLWLIVGKSYPISEKPKEETKPTEAVYRYRDGLREPFLYQFLFTMTGRLVMYTVMLYLFPLNPDFTVDAQFISLMIALTGIPGTIIGIVLAKKLKRQIHLFRFSGVAQSLLFFTMILTLYWTGAYTLQMIIYALVVHLVNLGGERSWYNAMLFTALYSLTFLVGTFLLPDFDRPKGAVEKPAGQEPPPKNQP